MVLVMLIMYAISVPLVVVAFVDSTWMGIVVNFFCVQSYWCLNEVARDLEDPFIYDPNDLPLARYQVWRPTVNIRFDSIVSVHITMSWCKSSSDSIQQATISCYWMLSLSILFWL